ncbi:MAG: hypothetical protein RLZZ308_755 [Candidatus Parcubacteria bacterium]|jgi:hypothetical protein
MWSVVIFKSRRKVHMNIYSLLDIQKINRMSLEELTKLGEYGFVDSSVFGSELSLGEFRAVPKLINLTSHTWSRNVFNELQSLKMRPATNRELLLFGILCPEEQHKKSILAFDEVKSFRNANGSQMLCLSSSGKERVLSMVYNEYWHKEWWYAVVCSGSD